jgi:transposase-like protein
VDIRKDLSISTGKAKNPSSIKILKGRIRSQSLVYAQNKNHNDH